MAGRILATFPTLDQSIQTVTIEDVQYRLRLTWRARCAGWYLDLVLLDGTPIALGRRLCAGIPVVIGPIVENAPPGMIVVRGTDDYARDDLGTALVLAYYATGEIAAARPLLDTVTEPALVVAPA